LSHPGIGCDTVDTLHAMFDGDIRVFFAINGNFISNTPDTVYSSHAMQPCKLTAHVSTKLNRSHLITGARALTLPCLGRTEEDIQVTGKQFSTVDDSMGIINPSQGFLPPASPDLMSDVAIISQRREGQREPARERSSRPLYDLLPVSRIVARCGLRGHLFPELTRVSGSM
jgi:anaerobic selenocysteine-containing dehydrogenase